MTQKFRSQSRNDLWCESTVLAAKIYQEDLPDLLPKHRVALHDEVHQRVAENNEKFKSIDQYIRRYGELPDGVDRSWWTSFKWHRTHLREFYKIVSAFIPDDKITLRNERVERDAQRAEAARKTRFLKTQSQRTKDRQFNQVLCDLLTEEFGEEAIQPIIKMAGAAANIFYELNPPQPLNNEKLGS